MTHKICLGKYSIDGCFSAIPYNRTAKKLIYNFKYSPFVSDLRKIIGELLYEYLLQNEAFQRQISNQKWILVPVPLHSEKLRKRGYNQAEILSEELSKRFEFEVLDVLKRTKKTGSQFGLTLSQRKRNIKGAFRVSSKVQGMNVFLVDDIVTTGSTLLEAANVLKRNGAEKVIGITLSRD
jgi:competence protein ComFC